MSFGKIMTPVHKLGNDPLWQFHFHAFFTLVWFFSMILVLFLPTFHGGKNIPALLIMEVSLWANFATHLGAMSASLAGIISQGADLEDKGVLAQLDEKAKETSNSSHSATLTEHVSYSILRGNEDPHEAPAHQEVPRPLG